MTQAWCVGVAENRRDELAEHELLSIGVGVHVPRSWQRERTLRGKMKTTYDLRIAPYLYLRFDLADRDQYAAVRSARGLSHVLEYRPETPGAISDGEVRAEVERERDERAGIATNVKGKRTDLILLAEHTITKHETAKGRTGKLLSIYGSTARLDCGRVLVTVPVWDIEPTRVRVA